MLPSALIQMRHAVGHQLLPWNNQTVCELAFCSNFCLHRNVSLCLTQSCCSVLKHLSQAELQLKIMPNTKKKPLPLGWVLMINKNFVE